MKFIDLFAGIGGFHLALQKNNMECVFASEIDKHAREVYMKNYNIPAEIFNDDIRKINPIDIPDHDLLCAGFPCQPFSQAGLQKGFNDGEKSERGNLFFCILDILEAKRPKAFILENVRYLLNHNKGETFARIKTELQSINYEINYKIIKASDFNIPQHRPRLFIVGFDGGQVDTKNAFNYPDHLPLTTTMSDIWGGDCNKKIGFTMRVGGKGSNINDRHNWDSYFVDGEVKRLSPLEGKKLMGFPANFILHPTKTHAMKQLGNSVCPEVVFHLAKQVKKYLLDNIKTNNDEKKVIDLTLNKGEWSEIYAFLKILHDNVLYFGTIFAETSQEYVTVVKIQHNNDSVYYSNNKDTIQLINECGEVIKEIPVEELISSGLLNCILMNIRESTNTTFQVHALLSIMQRLDISNFKGSASAKGDLILAFGYNGLVYQNQSIGIKSLIGGSPTLLNSSQATNFIFEIINFSGDMDAINKIDTTNKVRVRLQNIHSSSEGLKFIRCENKIHEDNLRKVDTMLPEFLSDILFGYYSGKGARLKELITDEQKMIRIKDYLKSITLGMFSTKKWDGNYSSEGYIIVKKEGEMLLYHVVKDKLLKDYLFLNSKLDTPSTTRHRFGAIYKEGDKYFIKLNLQIRMA